MSYVERIAWALWTIVVDEVAKTRMAVCDRAKEIVVLRRVVDGTREWLKHYDGDSGPNLRERDAIAEVTAALRALDGEGGE